MPSRHSTVSKVKVRDTGLEDRVFFFFCCTRSPLLHVGFLQVCGEWGPLSSCSAWAPRRGGSSCAGASSHYCRRQELRLWCGAPLAAYEIFPDQGSNLSPKLVVDSVDSQPLGLGSQRWVFESYIFRSGLKLV